jgi:nuclear factor of activated T-cells 5
MESDNDSMDNGPRKREPTLRHSRSDRDGTRRDGKRPRKRGPKRPPVNNPRLVSGYYSSSQLSSPTGDFDHYETIPNHQSDSNQQDQVMNQDPIFTFNQPPRLPSSEFRPQDQPRLTIIVQPGEHHRARYESEGSRGAVKDESGDGSPKIRLEGYRGNSTIPVHVFVSNEKGQIKPHIFFRTCKIASRNSTPCDDDEFILNGQRTDAIRINLSPKDDFTAIVDCVGILKLRNADVENESKSKSQPKPKRRNPTVRLAFHALIPNTDPSQPDLPLMVASNPISCSQPEGQPEILRMSSLLGNPEGGDEVFIIGKNFNKNCQIIFKSVECDWQGDATIHTSFFHKEHLVISTPKLHDTEIYADFPVKVHIQSQGKISEPYEKDFVYKPQVRIEAPESIQGPMKQLSVNQDGPPQTGRTQVVRADAPMREKRGSDASRPTPYDRGSVDRRQVREVSMYDTEQSYEPRDMKTEPDPNEPNQLVKPVPKTIDAPEGQLWIQPPRLVRIPRFFTFLHNFEHVYKSGPYVKYQIYI